MARHSFQIPPDLVPLAQELSHWRSTRPSPRSRLPVALLAKAHAATQKHSAAIVARSIGLDIRQLTTTAKHSVVGSSSAAVNASPPATVRLAPVIGLDSTRLPSAVVEVEAPNGWRMRICGGDVATCVKSLMEALR